MKLILALNAFVVGVLLEYTVRVEVNPFAVFICVLNLYSVINILSKN